MSYQDLVAAFGGKAHSAADEDEDMDAVDSEEEDVEEDEEDAPSSKRRRVIAAPSQLSRLDEDEDGDAELAEAEGGDEGDDGAAAASEGDEQTLAGAEFEGDEMEVENDGEGDSGEAKSNSVAATEYEDEQETDDGEAKDAAADAAAAKDDAATAGDTWSATFDDARALDSKLIAALKKPGASFKLQPVELPLLPANEHAFFDRDTLPPFPRESSSTAASSSAGADGKTASGKSKKASTAAASAAGAAGSESSEPSAKLLDYCVGKALAAQWARELNADAATAAAVAKRASKSSSSSNSKSSAKASVSDLSPDELASVAQLANPVQRRLFWLLNSYSDVWYSNRSVDNARALRQLYSLHVLNHVLKTRELVLRNNATAEINEAAERQRRQQEKLQARLAKQSRKGKRKRKQAEAANDSEAPATEQSATDMKDDSPSAGSSDAAAASSDASPPEPAEPVNLRDQGYTRPRVLVLLPFQNHAYDFVHTLLKLLPARNRQQVLNKRRFEEQFGPAGEPSDEAEAEDDGKSSKADRKTGENGEAGEGDNNDDEASAETKAPSKKQLKKRAAAKQKEKEAMAAKPADFRELFDGATDDNFKLGIALTRKSVKLFSDFYASDIIVASPLGLRLVVGTEGDKIKARDYDFLSSIELLVMDQADVFSLQNWQHVKAIFAVLNTIPYDSHGADFSRVRQWALNGLSKHFRQTLIFSAHANADLTALFARDCLNARGRFSLRASYAGALSLVLPAVRQIMQRVPCDSLQAAADARFEHFTQQVLPKVKAAATDGRVLIFVASYFDYLRLRNHMRARLYSFTNCCEYTSNADVSRARSAFYHGQKAFLLTTERFHHARRYRFRGVRHVLFYSPPENAVFYAEFLNMIQSAGGSAPSSAGSAAKKEQAVGDNTCLLLYTKYDALAMERIVGTERAAKMLASTNNFHMFV